MNCKICGGISYSIRSYNSTDLPIAEAGKSILESNLLFMSNVWYFISYFPDAVLRNMNRKLERLLYHK